jgi:hypothetical protein
MLDQSQIVKFALDIAKGMAYFHSLEPLIQKYHLNSFHIVVSLKFPKEFDSKFLFL